MPQHTALFIYYIGFYAGSQRKNCTSAWETNAKQHRTQSCHLIWNHRQKLFHQPCYPFLFLLGTRVLRKTRLLPGFQRGAKMPLRQPGKHSKHLLSITFRSVVVFRRWAARRAQHERQAAAAVKHRAVSIPLRKPSPSQRGSCTADAAEKQ